MQLKKMLASDAPPIQTTHKINNSTLTQNTTHLDVGPFGAREAQSLGKLSVQREATHEFGGGQCGEGIVEFDRPGILVRAARGRAVSAV